METNNITPDKPNNGRAVAGIIIAAIGGLLLLNELRPFFIPDWFFSWPMLMIAFGVYIGGKHNFRKRGWVWLVALGSAFLLTENINNADLFVWPLLLIGFGAWMALKPRKPVPVEYQENNCIQI